MTQENLKQLEDTWGGVTADFLQKCAKVAWQWNAIFTTRKLKEIKGKGERGMEGVTKGEGNKEGSLEFYA